MLFLNIPVIPITCLFDPVKVSLVYCIDTVELILFNPVLSFSLFFNAALVQLVFHINLDFSGLICFPCLHLIVLNMTPDLDCLSFSYSQALCREMSSLSLTVNYLIR